MFDSLSGMNHGVGSSQNTNRDVNQGLALLLMIAVLVVGSSWLFSTPVYFDLEIAAQSFPVLFSIITLFVVSRIQNPLLNTLAMPLAFGVIFLSWSFGVYLNINVPTMQNEAALDMVDAQLSGLSDGMYLLGLSLLILCVHRYFRFAIYVSSAAVFSLLLVLILLTQANITFVLAVTLLLVSSIVMSLLVFQSQAVQSSNAIESIVSGQSQTQIQIPDNEIAPVMEIDRISLEESIVLHDWEHVLRELQDVLKHTSEVDQLFKRMLELMHNIFAFDAAAVGMLQDKTMRKVAKYGDETLLDAQSIGWTSNRIKSVFASSEAIVTEQNITPGSSNKNGKLYRIDIPVLSGKKVLGVVSILQHNKFDLHTIQLASSMVFHTMLAYRITRLQNEIKRVSSDKPANSLTIYSRDEFAHHAKPVLKKLSQPRECSMCIVEIDALESMSESHGKEASVALFNAVSKVIMSELKPSDVMGRYGGEGFILLMDESDMNTAKAQAEVIRQKVSQLKLNYQSNVITTTVSIGLTIVSDAEDDLPTLMRKADMGLFVAKENGRNTVKVSL